MLLEQKILKETQNGYSILHSQVTVARSGCCGWWVVWPGPGAPSYWGCYAATSTASNTPSLASLRQATHCLQPRQPHYWHHTYTGSRGRPGSRGQLASAPQEPGTCPAGSRGCSQWWSSTRRFTKFSQSKRIPRVPPLDILGNFSKFQKNLQ